MENAFAIENGHTETCEAPVPVFVTVQSLDTECMAMVPTFHGQDLYSQVYSRRCRDMVYR